jgi:hypothetical protein
VIQENDHGELIVLESPEEQLRQRRFVWRISIYTFVNNLQFRRNHVVGGVKRGMDRHLFLIIDNSQAMDIVVCLLLETCVNKTTHSFCCFVRI